MFRQSHRAVVGTGYRHGLEHFVQRHLFSCFHVGLRASHGGGGIADSHHVIQFHDPFIDRFCDEEQGHNFGHRSDGKVFGSVFFIQNAPGFRFHQNGTAGSHIQYIPFHFHRFFIEGGYVDRGVFQDHGFLGGVFIRQSGQ